MEAVATTRYPETGVLRQVPGVGALTALSDVLTLEDPARFPKSRAVGSYLGLRPDNMTRGASALELRVTGPQQQRRARGRARARAPELPAPLAAELEPLLTVLAPLNASIGAADQRLSVQGETDPVVARLMTAPGIGPVTACALVATLDDISRFHSAHQCEAYLGLVPGERSSGEQRRIGPIRKAGNCRARWLLVEAAWRILRSKDPESAALRAWTLRIAARRGRRIAVVALARRLAGILYAMWRDGVPYDGRKIRLPHHPPVSPVS